MPTSRILPGTYGVLLYKVEQAVMHRQARLPLTWNSAANIIRPRLTKLVLARPEVRMPALF